MDLKTFVTETILQIISGVADATEKTNGNGASVNPRRRGKSPGDTSTLGMGVTEIHFDVALTVVQSETEVSSSKIAVAFFGIRGNSTGSSESSVTSRVQFTVPVSFPSQSRKQDSNPEADSPT